jgi:hypothetical protein
MTKWNWRNPEAAALHQIRRLAGLDPDGPLVPMQPHVTERQQFDQHIQEYNKHVRDHYLCHALRFT